MIVKSHMRLDITFFKKIHFRPVLYFSKVIQVFSIISIKMTGMRFVRSWILPSLKANKLLVSLMLSVKTQDSCVRDKGLYYLWHSKDHEHQHVFFCRLCPYVSQNGVMGAGGCYTSSGLCHS